MRIAVISDVHSNRPALEAIIRFAHDQKILPRTVVFGAKAAPAWSGIRRYLIAKDFDREQVLAALKASVGDPGRVRFGEEDVTPLPIEKRGVVTRRT